MRCKTTAGTAAGVLMTAVLLAGCSSTGKPATRTVTVTQAPATQPAPADTAASKTKPADVATTVKPAAKPSPKAASSWRMPNETGKVLQTAQDDIQALTDDGIFFTHSHDATGADRFQILDRDWKVCAQNVAPGRKITTDSDIVFDVVKLSETCP